MTDPVDAPHIFSFWRQQIFEFIWDNPGCTNHDIMETFYPRGRASKTTVSVHISMIKAGLREATAYDLITRHKLAIGAHGRPPNTYKIVKRAPQCQPQRHV